MCPLRIILIFLSATLAGFFVLRNIKSQSDTSSDTDAATAAADDSTSFCKSSPSASVGRSSSKIYGAFVNGFWTCVDMASGRYLWRNLVSASKQSD
ncbi:uncharacterized protein LOC111878729 [Lactuca sativa]|uniref:Uncharacterized protein n=1 Tax=Lactuca sativa TaxID=4236 RepID=A0A9R1VDZ8_LACSA|nr:uncharacterized protein LOC111878729 [Lactuca sativa]KAJ0202973.1 hypothetical protein LSAT_V11C500292790 [Lactuca sativa]